MTNSTANAPDTQDCVFLLSLDELNAYFPDEASRTADATEYAVARGGRVSRETGKTYWWLRTKATPEDAALMVRYGRRGERIRRLHGGGYLHRETRRSG